MNGNEPKTCSSYSIPIFKHTPCIVRAGIYRTKIFRKDNQSVMEFLECDEFKGAAGVRNTNGTEINPKNRRQPNRILYSSTSKVRQTQ